MVNTLHPTYLLTYLNDFVVLLYGPGVYSQHSTSALSGKIGVWIVSYNHVVDKGQDELRMSTGDIYFLSYYQKVISEGADLAPLALVLDTVSLFSVGK